MTPQGTAGDVSDVWDKSLHLSSGNGKEGPADPPAGEAYRRASDGE